MNKKIKLLLTIFVTCLILFASCSNEVSETKTDEQDNPNNIEQTVAEEIEEEEIVLPETSQQVDELPWEDDMKFQDTLAENETNILIAGFTTVFEGFTPEEHENIDLAAKTINGTVLQPGEVFSQNETAGPYTEEKGYKEGIGYVGGELVKDFGGGVCNVSTTLYNTAIASNLEIVERHNHSMPVSYVPYGQDAAVAYGYKDFQFKNNTENPILIWTELIDNRLYMGFYGKEQAPEITWEHETLSETETTTKYEINPDLNEGEENIIVEGMDGKVVNSFLIIKDENGEEKVRELGESAYNPMVELIEKGE